MMKIYETVNCARLVTSIEVRGKSRVISFDGGMIFPQWRAGIFQTDDVVLQDALEASSSFGIDFRLREKVKNEAPKREPVLKNIDGIKNKQMAIEWMRIHLGIIYSLATNPDVIRQTAAENGYSFLNWNRR